MCWVPCARSWCSSAAVQSDCWRFREIEVDLMPTASGILGFANRLYPLAVATVERRTLPSGVSIRLIAAPLFVATKFEAFADRGAEDLLGSHDLEVDLHLRSSG